MANSNGFLKQTRRLEPGSQIGPGRFPNRIPDPGSVDLEHFTWNFFNGSMPDHTEMGARIVNEIRDERLTGSTHIVSLLLIERLMKECYKLGRKDAGDVDVVI